MLHPLQTAMCWPSTLVRTNPEKRPVLAPKAGLRIWGRKFQSPNLPGSWSKDKGSGPCECMPYISWSLYSKRQTREWPSKSTGSVVGPTLAYSSLRYSSPSANTIFVLLLLIITHLILNLSFLISFISSWVLALLVSFPFGHMALLLSFIHVLS